MSVLEDLLKNMPDESDWFLRIMGKLDELVDEMEDGTSKAATRHVVGVLKNREEDLKGRDQLGADGKVRRQIALGTRPRGRERDSRLAR